MSRRRKKSRTHEPNGDDQGHVLIEIGGGGLQKTLPNTRVGTLPYGSPATKQERFQRYGFRFFQ